MTDQWTDKLSDYLDGELPAAERSALEAHLAQCESCGQTLRQLEQVVARAGQVIDREPAHDLWPAIAARVAGGQEIQEAAGATSSGKRRFSFSIPQLAAASVALMLMSAGTMYLMVRGGGVEQVAEAPQQVTAQPAAAGSASVRVVTRNYDAAVAELESVLERNRNQLDSTTVRVLEQNLAIIDRAINDARAALGQEPANPYLSRYLDQAMQKKVQLLRRATSVMRAET